MKYETAKNLNNTRFKRLIGVAKPVFDEMVKVLKAEYQVKHARGGRKPKLAIEDLLLATLQYLKEYRTYEQIAADYGVHDSNLIRRSHWAEETLVKHGFNIGKQEIRQTVIKSPLFSYYMLSRHIIWTKEVFIWQKTAE